MDQREGGGPDQRGGGRRLGAGGGAAEEVRRLPEGTGGLAGGAEIVTDLVLLIFYCSQLLK